MAKTQDSAPVDPAVDEAAPEVVADVAAPTVSDPTSATVLTDQGAFIRTYTKEIHGDVFQDNAREFSGHTPGSTVVLS